MSKTYKDMERRIKRQRQVEEGVYDGRYMTKVVEDKTKKKHRKKSTRDYINEMNKGD